MRAVYVALMGLLSFVSACHASEDRCLIFDGTMYINKPAQVSQVMLGIQLAYESDLWDASTPKSPMPSREKVEHQATLAANRDVFLVLDIERWPVHSTISDADVSANIDKLNTVVSWVRDKEPNVKVGYWSLAPMPAVSWALAPEGSADNLAWRRANDRLIPLAEKVDIIFPHAYTYRNNPDEWARYSVRNIEEARRYNKPVLLFIWPQYSERNQDLGYQFIDAEFWRRQLNVSCQNANGVVIWGGWDPKFARKAEWNDEAEWWKEVKLLKGAEEEAP